MRSAVLILVLASAGLAQRNEKLHELFNQYNEDFLRENPMIATSRGRNDYNDRWKDWSPAGLERRTSQMQRYLDQLQPFLNENLSNERSEVQDILKPEQKFYSILPYRVSIRFQ